MDDATRSRVKKHLQKITDEQLWDYIQVCGPQLFQECEKNCHVVDGRLTTTSKYDKLYIKFVLLIREECRRTKGLALGQRRNRFQNKPE